MAPQEAPQGLDTGVARLYGWRKPRQRTLYWRDGSTSPMALLAIEVVRYQQGADPSPSYW